MLIRLTKHVNGRFGGFEIVFAVGDRDYKVCYLYNSWVRHIW